MTNEEIYNNWTNLIDGKYKQYFTSNEDNWMDTLEQVKTYIDANNKRPSSTDKDNQIKQLGSWISHQQDNYKKKAYIMTNEEIYNNWANLLNDAKYKQYFTSNEDNWMETFEQVKTYIDTNNKRPSKHDKDKQIKQFGQWIANQQNNYKKKAKIMKNEEIYNNWTNLVNDAKYKQYFTTKPDRRIRIDE
jgi:hypothetical protein